MKLYIDRIEGDKAVCQTEDEIITEFLVSELPDGSGEGSVLLVDENGCITLDNEAQSQRKQFLFELQSSLFDE